MRRLLCAATLGALASTLAFTPGVEAQWRPDGAVSGDLLIREGTVLSDGSAELGGGAVIDLLQPFGIVRVGFAFGLQGLSGGAEGSRIFTPITAAFTVGNAPRPVGAELRLRAGLWTGATNSGFAAGGLLTAGAFLVAEVDPTVRVAIGMEGWFLFGHGDAIAFAPTVSLAWSLDRQ